MTDDDATPDDADAQTDHAADGRGRTEPATTSDSDGTTTATRADGGVTSRRESAAPGGLMANLRLFVTLLRKELIITVRYPVNFAGGLVTLFAIFVGLLVGGRRFGGPQFDETVGGVVVGYLLFTMAMTSYQSLANSIQTEAGWGTLERLHMSPLGFGRLMLCQSVVRVVVSFLWIALILPPVLWLSGESLAVDPLTVVPIAALGVTSVLGVGLLFGGASVLYKRVSRIFQLFQFVLIALIAAPVGELPWLRALPVVQANVMLGRAMREGVRIWEFSPVAHATLVAAAVGYLALGYLGFTLFVRRARKLGVMGDY